MEATADDFLKVTHIVIDDTHMRQHVWQKEQPDGDRPTDNCSACFRFASIFYSFTGISLSSLESLARSPPLTLLSSEAAAVDFVHGQVL
ncbi:hypothetical protein Cob_v002840 [Colletotrichum orbiculare MAFF 240422]|uniref:Uncharacterized protein n=1 Tax=Colletotrichum orbiculare (strain 104-T / ATCC 96160 / CBS 514.97 / LARS 414 / MAFF 240422) TaxID=1213857 RepID=A0A484G1E7_COLOR|nr:hypothetical protein Cob_v002840 [Colletotrichum orbiculare MAFF 240422]